MKIVGTGNTYKIYADNLQTYDKLPIGVYQVNFAKLTGFFLEKRPDITISEKLYGNHQEKVIKILDAFKVFERNLGVIFSGDKGIGKSVAAKLLAQLGTERGYPVILVNEYLPGIADFLNQIEQEVIVVFDEFDKTFVGGRNGGHTDDGMPLPDRQTELLTLLDGFGIGKKLYAVTCNSLYNLNDFMVNRPGRFHYHIIFSYPSPEEIREYLHDKLKPEYYNQIEDVVCFSQRIDLNYDCLRAIAFELNLGNKFGDAIADLNIVNFNRGYDKYVCFLTLDNGEKLVIKKFEFDSMDTDEVSLWFDNGKWRYHIWFTPADDMEYNLARGCSLVSPDRLNLDEMEIWKYEKSEEGRSYREEVVPYEAPKIKELAFKRILEKTNIHYAA